MSFPSNNQASVSLGEVSLAALENITAGIDQTDPGVTDSVTVKSSSFGAAGDAAPALATNASGVLGWLRKIVDVLSGTPAVAATNAQVTTATATIANAASLSSAIDLGTARLARIAMPAAWTAANLTFQASPDGSTWNDLYDSYGTEYTVTAAASRSIILPLSDFLGIRYLKIRSGTSAAAVAQGADRTITLVLVP